MRTPDLTLEECADLVGLAEEFAWLAGEHGVGNVHDSAFPGLGRLLYMVRKNLEAYPDSPAE